MSEYAIRDGTRFKIVDECETDVCVECEFDFANKPHKRILKLWWSKDYVDEIIDDELPPRIASKVGQPHRPDVADSHRTSFNLCKCGDRIEKI